MVTSASVTELRSNAYRVSNVPEAAFDNVLCSKPAANLRNVRRLTLIRERGIARQHTQRLELPDRRNELLAEAVGEIFLTRITGKVVERQHGDSGRFVGG